MVIDDAATIAEVRAVVDAYEDALMNNRAEVLDAIFWDDPRTVRFGITEMLFGADEIRAFRRGIRSYAPRQQQRVEIHTFGPDFAVTNLVYRRIETGAIGRETKIMARIPGHGWRVVSAHVSLLAAADTGTRR